MPSMDSCWFHTFFLKCLYHFLQDFDLQMWLSVTIKWKVLKRFHFECSTQSSVYNNTFLKVFFFCINIKTVSKGYPIWPEQNVPFQKMSTLFDSMMRGLLFCFMVILSQKQIGILYVGYTTLTLIWLIKVCINNILRQNFLYAFWVLWIIFI